MSETLPVNKLLIMVNPASGSYQDGVFRECLAGALDSIRFAYEVYRFTNEDALREKIESALKRGVNLVAAAGGDGTVNLVADLLQGRGIPLGIIPTGTGNTLARYLGIPLDFEEALTVAATSSHRRVIDGFLINGRLFHIFASAGLSSKLLGEVDKQSKSLFGRLVYVFAGVRLAFSMKEHRFLVVIDGRNYELKAAEVMVVNTTTWGIAMAPDPDIRPDDGELEVFFIRKASLPEFFGVLLDALSGGQKRTLRYLGRGKRITLESGSGDSGLPVQADGDIVAAMPVTVEVRPQATTFVVP